MAIQIKVPAVGESITEVTIASWVKKDGETVKLDEIIAELESDKATFELTATSAGVLKIVKPEGSTVPIGEVLCEIEPGQTSGGAPAPAAEPAKATPAEAPAPYARRIVT